MNPPDALPLHTPRPDTWAAANASCQVQYRIRAEAQPALLCQVLNLFAMQYLVPCQVQVLRDADGLEAEVQVDGLSWHRAQVIAEKMRNLIDVDEVQLNLLQPLPVLAQACG